MISDFGIIYDGTKKTGSVSFQKDSNKKFTTSQTIQPHIEETFLEDKNENNQLLTVNEENLETYKVYHSSEETKKANYSFFKPLLLYLSSGFIGISLFGMLFLFWPVLVQEVRYQLILKNQSTAEEKIVPGFPKGDQWSPPNTTFSIVVPKIDAKASIIANVDASLENDYQEALKKGVAQAKGTCFPGMDCTMYLFAHSAGSSLSALQNNAVFYLLRKLEKGDQLIIYYYGKKILYEVYGKEIVTEKDTHYITNTGNEERLILQTCDPPGTTLNRLLVFAKPKLVEYLK